ncbi:hypothetical protein Tco_0785739 [Tanacetum coccineum]
MTVDDLLQLVPKLITKVDSLETELKQTKLTIGKALVTLVKKGRKISALQPWKQLKLLSTFAFFRSQVSYKGKRYKRRIDSKGNEIDTGLKMISNWALKMI